MCIDMVMRAAVVAAQQHEGGDCCIIRGSEGSHGIVLARHGEAAFVVITILRERPRLQQYAGSGRITSIRRLRFEAQKSGNGVIAASRCAVLPREAGDERRENGRREEEG